MVAEVYYNIEAECILRKSIYLIILAKPTNHQIAWFGL